jgi:hypothetical protein
VDLAERLVNGVFVAQTNTNKFDIAAVKCYALQHMLHHLTTMSLKLISMSTYRRLTGIYENARYLVGLDEGRAERI